MTISRNKGKQPVISYACCLVAQSSLTLCDPWTVALQAPPSMEFSRQEYWRGLPFSTTGDLPDPGLKLWSPTSQAGSLPSAPPGKKKLKKL